MIIYKTTNLLNGKIYIGQDSHNNPNYYGSGDLIKRAIKKYGIENFRKDVVEYCTSQEHMNEREIYWIACYNSVDRSIGYNITPGGNKGPSRKGCCDSEKTRMKKSLAQRGNKANLGKHWSDETKEKLRKAMIGNQHTLGVYPSEETRKKMSLARKGKKLSLSEEGREKLSITARKNHLGTHLSDITKEKLRQAMTGRYVSEETKKKQSQAAKGKTFTKEHRANLSTALKGRKVWNKGKKYSIKK